MHILCVICSQPIFRQQHTAASCWTDPGGTTVAAHNACLVRVGASYGERSEVLLVRLNGLLARCARRRDRRLGM